MDEEKRREMSETRTEDGKSGSQAGGIDGAITRIGERYSGQRWEVKGRCDTVRNDMVWNGMECMYVIVIGFSDVRHRPRHPPASSWFG